MIRLFIFLYGLWYGGYKDYTGGCLKFHFVLMDIFGGDGYYNSSHVITKIGDKYYDIGGIVHDTADYLHMSHFGSNYFVNSFRGLGIEEKNIIKNFNKYVQ